MFVQSWETEAKMSYMHGGGWNLKDGWYRIARRQQALLGMFVFLLSLKWTIYISKETFNLGLFSGLGIILVVSE